MANYNDKSPFAETGVQLIELGYSAIPIMYNNKYPAVYDPAHGWKPLAQWQQYASRYATPSEYDWWAYSPSCGVGVCLGELSGIVALDFDDRPDLWGKIEGLILESPVKKKGQRGYTAFYKYSGEVNKKWIVDNVTVLELLSVGRQTVLPPSAHPAGGRYTWITKQTLLTIDKEDLPELPKDFSAQVDKILNIKPNSGQPKKQTKLAKLEDISKALSFISSDNYEIWVKVGMALHNEGFDFSIWDEWSKTSKKYKDGETAKKWNTFRRGAGYTAQSIFWLASQAGYRSVQDEVFTIPFLESTKKASLVLPEKLVSSAPNLVGRIKDWIVDSSIFPQPELALAGAICLVGTLKAQKVQSDTGLRTNNYILGIAPSGSGKDHAITCIQEILRQTEQMALYGGKPASDSGILSMLTACPRRIVVWDEIGLALKELVNERSQSHKKAILSLIMELFSSANRVYAGKEYANKDQKSPRIDINQPCLNVYGITTPQHFYDSLSMAMIDDGFLARWLVFDIQTTFPDPRDVSIDRYKIPDDLLKEIIELKNYEPAGGAFEANAPTVIPFTTEAKEEIKSLFVKYNEMKKEQFKKFDGLQSLWARATEHVIKLALVAQAGEHVQLSDVLWAEGLVEHCLSNMCAKLETGLNESQFGKHLEAVKRILAKESTQVNLRDLKRKLSRLMSAKDIQECLAMLSESGEIHVEKIKTNGRATVIVKLQK